MNKLLKKLEIREFAENEIIFRVGEVSSDMFIVLKGHVGIFQDRKKSNIELNKLLDLEIMNI